MTSGRRLALVAMCAAAATAGGWVWFASRFPSRVMVGTQAIGAWVPPHYQASVLPVFGAYVGALGIDLVSGNRTAWVGRAGLVGIVSTIAGLRLSGWIGLSGHAVCCAALAAESMVRWKRTESGLVVALAVIGLVVTGWYKLGVWGDRGWFFASVAVGVGLGLACSMWGRRQHDDEGEVAG